MKRLFFCIPAFLFAGCMMMEEPEISASQLAAMPENQTRHYRPVHRLHEDWSISELGKTLTIYADTRVKLSARRQPNRVVIREDGNIIGHVEATPNGAKFVSNQEGQQTTIEFQCLSHHEAQLVANQRLEKYKMTETGATNDRYEVTKQPPRRRYSIAQRPSPNTPTDACNGTELESPFNAYGTLLFHADDLPFAPRTALSWYLTYFKQTCAAI